MTRSLLNVLAVALLCCALVPGSAQITTTWPGGCPIVDTVGLDEECLSVFDPSNIEASFVPGGGGSLSFSYTGDQPGQMINGGHGSLIETMLTVYEVDMGGMRIDSLDCDITVRYLDLAAPVIICPADIIRDGGCQVVNGLTPSIEENCDQNYEITFDIVFAGGSGFANISNGQGSANGNMFPVGLSQVIYSFPTDVHGNQPSPASCTIAVQINGPAEPPIITDCPDDITINTDPGSCSAEIILDPVAAMDACSGISGLTITNSFNDGGADASGFYPSGKETVLFTVSNPQTGLTSSCFVEITVRDREAPNATNCPDDIHLRLTSGNNISILSGGAFINDIDRADCSVLANILLPDFADNCDVVTYVTYQTIEGGSLIRSGILGDDGDPDGQYSFPPGSYTIIYKARDQALNQSTCQFNLLVEEDEKPQIQCPSIANNFSLESDACEKVFEPGELMPVAADNCGLFPITYHLIGPGNNEVFGTGDPGLNETFSPGDYELVFFAEDLNGNIDSCTIDFSVVDNVDPVFDCNENTSGGPVPGEDYGFVNIPPSVTDNCQVASLAHKIIFPSGAILDGTGDASGVQFPFGTSNVIYTALDLYSNIESCQFEVTISTISPSCPFVQDTNYLNTSCFSSIDPSDITSETFTYLPNPDLNVIVDFQGNGKYTPFPTPDDPDPDTQNFGLINGVNILTQAGTYSVDFALQVFDDQGTLLASTNPCKVQYAIIDTLSPFLDCPADMQIAVNDILGSPGNCPLIPDQLGYDLSLAVDDNCEDVEITYEITDAGGLVYASGNGSAGMDVFAPGINTVSYTATDPAGNDRSCDFEVEVFLIEDTPPDLICPGPIEVFLPENCDTVLASGELALMVTDNCISINSLDLEYEVELPDGTLIGPFAGGDASDGSLTYELGTYTIFYQATDGNGNTGTCETVLHVWDDSPAQLSADCSQGDTVYYLSSVSCSRTLLGLPEPTAIDDCPGAEIHYMISGADQLSGIGSVNGLSLSEGQYSVHYEAVSADGRAGASCSFEVLIVDTLAPVLICPDPITAQAGPDCEIPVFGFNPQVTDACGVEQMDYTVIYPDGSQLSDTGDPNGSLFPAGVSTVLFTAVDSSGNESNVCSVIVDIRDETPPTILMCPPDTVINLPFGCESLVELPSIVLDDNCPEAVLVSNDYNLQNGQISDIFPLGSTTINFTASDGSGNSTTCNTTVTINEPTDPQVLCPQDMTLSTDPEQCEAVAMDITPTSICDMVDVEYTLNFPAGGQIQGIGDASGEVFPVGVSTVEYVFLEDDTTEVSSCTFTLTVEDNELPQILFCPDPVTVSAGGDCTADVTIPPIQVSDNCSIQNVINNQSSDGLDASGIYPIGTSVAVFTVIDDSGNESYCEVPVTVEDPGLMLTCPADITVTADSQACEDIVNNIDPVVSGTSCTNANVAWEWTNITDTLVGDSTASGNLFAVGIHTIQYYIGDINGPLSCTFTVQVDGDPVLPQCPSDTTLQAIPGSCGVPVFGLAPEIDSCQYELSFEVSGASVYPLQPGVPDGLTFSLGMSTVTYYYTDAFADTLVELCTREVLVLDGEKPQLSCPGDLVIQTDGNQAVLLSGTDPGIGVINAGCSIELNQIPGIANDNCGLDVVSYFIELPDGSIVNSPSTGIQDASGFFFPVGVSTVNYFAADASGNSRACSFTVDIRDSSLPAFDECSNYFVSNGTIVEAPGGVFLQSNNACRPIFGGTERSFSDNCGSLVRVDVVINGATNGQAINSGDGNNAIITGALIGHAATDGINSIDGVTFNVGVSNVTLTAFDEYGNKSICNFEVEVEEFIPPSFDNCPNDLTLGTDLGSCQRLFSANPPLFSENCGSSGSTLMYQVETPAFSGNIMETGIGVLQYELPTGQARIIYQLFDVSGNLSSNSCSYLVTIIDNERPALTCPSPPVSVINSTTDDCETAVNNIDAIFSDNCDAQVAITHRITFPDGSMTGSLQGSASGKTFPVGQSTVTYTARDDNNNTRTCTFTVVVEDEAPPSIVSCPDNLNMAANINCEGIVNLPSVSVNAGVCAPAFTEDLASHYLSEEGAAITSSSPGDTNVLVDPINMAVQVPGPPDFAGSSVALDIYLYNIDAANNDGTANQEFFLVYGEDSTLVGQTAIVLSDCDGAAPLVHPFYANASISSSFTIPPGLFNAWAADGQVEFILQPNIPEDGNGDPLPLSMGINDLCGNSRAIARLRYDRQKPDAGLSFFYRKNNGPLEDGIPVLDTFPEGLNSVTYYVADAADNQDSCSFVVEVKDEIVPEFDMCPPGNFPLSYEVSACDTLLELPFHGDILENCGSTSFVDSVETLMSFNNDGSVDTILLQIVGVAVNVAGDATLTVSVRGDVDDPDEYFNVFGEAGFFLGTTTAGDCSVPGVVTFTIDQAQMNDWADDGLMEISLVPFDAMVSPEIGIDGDPDIHTIDNHCPGVSMGPKRVVASLSYPSFPPVFYEIEGATTVSQQAFPQDGTPEATFSIGDSEVTYSVSDESGNIGACAFTVSVADNIPPELECIQATTVFVNPSGLFPDTLDVNDLVVSVSDNCSMSSVILSDSIFDCSLAGGPLQQVMVIASDIFGNESTCQVNIRVETEELTPDYSVGICGNDTLYLFADTSIIPPGAGGVFTYAWTGPVGFTSSQANPILPQATSDNSGTYTLTMTGASGCSSTGSVFVQINVQPNTPTITSPDADVCDNEDVLLQTQTYTGASVTYFWYEGISPMGTLLDSTTVPNYFIPDPSAGTFLYYVVVTVDGCSSNPSSNIEINITASPDAQTNDDQITLCEEGSFNVGTSVTGPGFIYTWNGPNGFQSNLPNPPAIQDAGPFDSGVYYLVISSGGCSSDPDSTVVEVLPKPEQPAISSNSPICIGDTLRIFTNNNTADHYIWSSNALDTDTTAIPELLLVGQAPDTKEWRLQVEENGCLSDVSEWIEVTVEDIPVADAANNGPLCPGDALQLFVNVIPGASYSWTGPDGFASQNPQPVVNANAGTYYVEITTSGNCMVMDSTEVVILDPPVISDVISDAPDCVTGTETVTLEVMVNPADDGSYTYFWQGPNGFTSIDPNPVIANANSDDNGTYSVVVTDGNGCTSMPASVVLDVTDTPDQPDIEPTDPICEGDQLTLSTMALASPDADYFWILPSGDTLQSASSTLNIPSANVGNDGEYQVFIELNGCRSSDSQPEFVEVNPVPETPVIMGQDSVCESTNLELGTDFVPGAFYIWGGPGGFVSTQQNPVVQNIQLGQGGTYSLMIDVDGCISEMDTLDVFIKPKPQAPQIANNGPACEGEVVTLTASVGNAGSYLWTSPTFKEYFSPINSLTLINSIIEAGDWTVRVESDGCFSDESDPTFVDIIPSPTAPLLQVDTQLCVGDDILLSSDSIADPTAQYSWITPRGTFNSQVPFLNITGAGLGDSGDYGLIVRVNGCPSDTSFLKQVNVYPIPPSPVLITNSPVCEGEEIRLVTNQLPGATYQWTGPNGFTSGVPEPVLPAIINYAGLYTLTITLNGCTSPPTTSEVEVIVPQNSPGASATAEVCLDDPDGSFNLFIEPGTEIPGASYLWFNAATDTLVAGPTSSTSVTIDNLQDFGAGSFSFYVIAMLEDCGTNASIPVVVNILETPDVMAFAGNDQELCGVSSTTLSAALPPMGFSGTWVQTCGPNVNIGNPNAPTTSVSGLLNGVDYCFTWTLDYGPCGSSSDEMTVRVYDIGESSFAGVDQELCNVSEAFLSAGEPASSATGRWSQPGGQTALGILIEDPNNLDTRVSGLIPGNTFFFIWTLSNAGCGSFSRDTVEVYVAEADVNQAACGDDFVACGDGSVVLECVQPADGDGFWTALNPGVDIVTPDRPNTLVLGLETGTNTFIWTLSNDACGVFSADTIVVAYELVSIPNPDVEEVDFAGSVTIDVLDNDIIRSDFMLEIDEEPLHGQVQIDMDDNIIYTVDPGYAGSDEFFYRLCSMTCPDVCERAKVSINVVNTGCVAPSIITPNRDGVNDAFIVPCLATEDYPQNEVAIFNQWGDEIFRSSPYQNDWEGTYNGEDVPPGTYYYVIRYGGGQPPQSGFLVIQR